MGSEMCIRDRDSSIGEQSKVTNLKGSNPFKHSCVFIEDFSLFKVKRRVGILRRHVDEWLIEEVGMVDIFL